MRLAVDIQLLPQMSPAAATTGSPSTVAAPPDGTKAIKAAESIDVATATETTLRSIEPPFQSVNTEYKCPVEIRECRPATKPPARRRTAKSRGHARSS